MWPPIAARSEPQMPARFGMTRTQSGAGRVGSGTSPSFSIERALVATSGRPPAALTTAKAGMERTYWRANMLSRPPPPPPPPPGGGGNRSPPLPPFLFWRARGGARAAPHVPPPPPPPHPPPPPRAG